MISSSDRMIQAGLIMLTPLLLYHKTFLYERKVMPTAIILNSARHNLFLLFSYSMVVI